VRAIAQPISEYSVVRQLMALKRSGELSMVYDIGYFIFVEFGVGKQRA
jgi:hypothetical protein